MSSTGRVPAQGTLSGLARERHPDDFYRTPRWAVEALLGRVGYGLEGPILEPGCGDGAILEVLRDHQHGPLLGVEKDPERCLQARLAIDTGATVCTDFLGEDLAGDLAQAAPAYLRPRAAISNPPFRLAQAFIEQTLDVVEPGGCCWFLLRLAFLAGQRRAASGLWEHLAAVYVLPRRPSFTGDGTDSCDYAWFEFRAGSLELARLEHLGL